MATRPWITPKDVTDYTEYAEVKARAEAKLNVDISRAEQYVITYTNNTFDTVTDGVEETLPEPVKTALILLAESYAYNAIEATRRKKSESFDDYSYTEQSNTVEISSLGLEVLLDEYKKKEAKNGVVMKLRIL